MELQLFCICIITAFLTTSGVLGYPSSENQTTDQCPEDSVLVNETCECDHSLCTAPPQCDQPLTLIANSSNTPGKCCPIYTCDLCTKESIVDGTCMCAVGAVRTLDGNCECTDPMRSLQGGVCTCDANKCPRQAACSSTSVQVRTNTECCHLYECIECPEDSYPLSLHSPIAIDGDEMEDKCICYPCEETACESNQTASIIRRGRQFAGECCDVYTCEYRACHVDGTRVSHGDVYVMAAADDDVRVCHDGSLLPQTPLQMEKSSHCLHDAELIANGTQWMDDECTQCTCVDEKVTCIAGFCNTAVVPVANASSTCCAPLTACTITCTYGLRISEHGCAECKCNDIHDSFSLINNYMWHHNISEEDIIRKLTESPGFAWNLTVPSFVAGALFLLITGIVIMAAHTYCKCPCRRQKKFHESEKVLLK